MTTNFGMTYRPLPPFPEIRLVDKYPEKEYTSMVTPAGVVLCEKQTGSFLILRYSSDLERLRVLLNKITIVDDKIREL